MFVMFTTDPQLKTKMVYFLLLNWNHHYSCIRCIAKICIIRFHFIFYFLLFALVFLVHGPHNCGRSHRRNSCFCFQGRGK